MRRLANDKPGPGYCHFPKEEAYDEAYFKGLTAEKLVTRYIKGQPKREWTKPDKARNEPLDCRAYAFAALKIMKPNLRQIQARILVQSEELPKRPEIPKVASKSPEIDNQPSKEQKPRKRWKPRSKTKT
jgi:phage terminase large subunit GpA-like protein